MTENTRTDLTVKAEIELYYDVHVPDGLATPAPLLIAVHGYGAHKRYMMREAKLVTGGRYVIAAIEAPHPHYRPTKDGGYAIGYGWLSERRPEPHIRLHHDFVNEVIDRLVQEGLADAGRVFMYGFSQACALDLRFAFTYPDRLAGIAGVCGGIPGDLDTNPTYTPFAAQAIYLYGDDDEFYTNDQFAAFDAKLRSLLPNYASKQFTAKHEITEEMRSELKQFFTGQLSEIVK